MRKQVLLVLLMLLLVVLEEVGGFLSLFRPRFKQRRKHRSRPKEILRDLKTMEKTIEKIKGINGRRTQVNNPRNSHDRFCSQIPQTAAHSRHHSDNHGHYGNSYSPQPAGYVLGGHSRHSFVGYDQGIFHGRAPIYGPVYYHGVSNIHDPLFSGGHYHWYPNYLHDNHVLGYQERLAPVEKIYPVLKRKDEARYLNLPDQHFENQVFTDDELYSHEHETYDENLPFESDFSVEAYREPHGFPANTYPYLPVGLSSNLHSAEDDTSNIPHVHSSTREAYNSPGSFHVDIENKKKGLFFSKIVAKKKPLAFPFFGHQMQAAGSHNALVLHNDDLSINPQKETSVSRLSNFNVSGTGNTSFTGPSNWDEDAWEPLE